MRRLKIRYEKIEDGMERLLSIFASLNPPFFFLKKKKRGKREAKREYDRKTRIQVIKKIINIESYYVSFMLLRQIKLILSSSSFIYLIIPMSDSIYRVSTGLLIESP